MELGYAAAAIRRRLWLVVLFAALGALTGLFAGAAGSTHYKATSLLLLAPASDVAELRGSDESDRYVAGQVAVLSSSGLRQRVAEALGDGAPVEKPRVVSRLRSDIVELVVEAATPERARDVASAYANEYIASLVEEVTAGSAAQLAALDQLLLELQASLDEVDAQILLRVRAEDKSSASATVPPLEQIAPDLVTAKQILVAQYEGAAETKRAVRFEPTVWVRSRIVQLPGVEIEQTSTNRTLVPIIGAVAGGLAGIVLALLLARKSGEAIDTAQAEAALGMPFAAYLTLADVAPGARPRSGARGAATRAVDELAVRAERHWRGSDALTVLVTSAAGTDSSQLTGALVQRLARTGTEVVVSSLDSSRPGPDTRGVPAVVAMGPPRGAMGPSGVAAWLATMRDSADVVVIDAGPILESSSVLRCAQLVDVIVLVVPDRGQPIRELTTIASELSERCGHLLPVLAIGRAPRMKGANGPPAGPVESGPRTVPSPATNGDSGRVRV